MIEAAIDVGTNTMLLLVADIATQSRQILKVLDDQIDFVRLGQGVHQNRVFSREAMERAICCFKKYKTICEQCGTQRIFAVATSASRDAKNAFEFYKQVKSKTGIDVKVISGEQEASFSFWGGLLPTQNPNNAVVLDIGGGSTEFVTLSSSHDKVVSQSLDIGSVRATEVFLREDPYAKDSILEMMRFLRQLWPTLDSTLQKNLLEKEWVAIAGTPTTLAGLQLQLKHFDSVKLDGYKMSFVHVKEWLDQLSFKTQQERAQYSLIDTGRADIIVAGAAILYTAMEYFNKNYFITSTRGLRYGVLMRPIS